MNAAIARIDNVQVMVRIETDLRGTVQLNGSCSRLTIAGNGTTLTRSIEPENDAMMERIGNEHVATGGIELNG